MPTIRQRRVTANPPAQPLYPAAEHVYTEEDYAIPDPAKMPEELQAVQAPIEPAGYFPDDAFLPDAEELPEGYPEDAFTAENEGDAEYGRLFEGVFDDDFDDLDDPLDEELLTDEEMAELRRSHWQLLSGLADFAGIILGTAVILILVTLLVSLINWLVNDMSQSFILLQKHF